MEVIGHRYNNRAARLMALIAFCALLIGLAELGTALSHGDLGFSTLWPPCGLYFIALTFSSNIRREWIGLFVAAASANIISDWFIHDFSLTVTLCFIASDTLSATSAAIVTRRFLVGSKSLDNLRNMLVFMLCGLLIHAPIAATFGLWFQVLFWSTSWTWLKWVAWWSSNALGVSCFGIISFYVWQKLIFILLERKISQFNLLTTWQSLKGTRAELWGLWASFITLASFLLFEMMPPWGLFLLNLLIFIWTFRFGILHSSLVLAVGCIVQIYHAISSWEYLSPFSRILLLQPPTHPDQLKIATVVSVQLFLIERSFVVNLAAALFTDLHVKQGALREAAESRERLMARMSHEIRTPLSGVLGLIEAWAINEKSMQRANELQMILNSGAQLKRVIDDVLDFSKITAGKMNVEPVKCQLRELFSEIISLHAADALKKKISLNLKISDDTPDEILIDSFRLRQIMNNLIANAIKFTPTGFVSIGVSTDSASTKDIPQLRITVEDSGIGISQISMKSLFQPFEQLGSETTRAYGGTGLGLAICRELTELLGGHIDVKSSVGIGTLFTVYLPYSSIEYGMESTESAPKYIQTPAPKQIEKKQILIVEDDPINQLVASRFIEAEGFSARVVSSGTQALELLKQHSEEFVLVLMDYFMPVMDGCEVTRQFRTSEKKGDRGSHLPIVGLTASVLPIDHLRCRQAGMDDVLLKPIEREALRAAINKFIAA